MEISRILLCTRLSFRKTGVKNLEITPRGYEAIWHEWTTWREKFDFPKEILWYREKKENEIREYVLKLFQETIISILIFEVKIIG